MTDGADRLEVGVLGPFEAMTGGQPAAIRGMTERALLARLALDANLTVSNRRIADGIWGDDVPRRPRQAIHALVFRLRQALGEAAAGLQTSDQGYSLRLGDGCLDVWRFEALVALGRQAQAAGDLDTAAGQLSQALAVWRGDALAGLDDYPFAPPRARQLGEARFETLVTRIEVDLGRGLHVRLVPELEGLVLERPTHEGLCRLLMTALYRCGRQVDALAVYDALRKRLAGQFGIDPSAPLQQLEVQMLRQDPKLDWRPAAGRVEPESARPGAAGPQRERARGNLPHPLTSFIGREAELAEVTALLGQHRLVTIAGPGGCGKSRLAIAVGHQLAKDGEVRFVRLEGLADTGLVAVAVAEALGIRLGGSDPPTAEIADALADRDVLVVFDTCEHVRQACADLVIAVLESAADVRFLLTSREPLAIPGEVVWRLPSLTVPDPGAEAEALESAEAVQLFLDRAAASAGRAGQLSRADLPAVAAVCRRLDGIPLAIELAAARLATLSLDQLSQRLADRFSVLDAGSRSTLPRHRTLQAAMAWSHDLLDDTERRLFRRLSVFAAAFPLEAAEAVCAGSAGTAEQVCGVLGRVAGKSLVTVEPGHDDLAYRLLNTIREYAGSWLTDQAERDELARRHHDWFLGQATEAVRAMHGSDLPRWARRMRSCADDIRAALDWALGPGGGGAALAAQMWEVWNMQDQIREGRQWIARALGRGGDAPREERASLLLGGAVLALAADDYGEASRLLGQATRVYQELGHAAGTARCCLELGRLQVVKAELGPAECCAGEARRQYADLADEWGVAWADVLAGNVLVVRGEYEAATGPLRSALAAGRRLGNPLIVGDTVVYLGLVALRSDRMGEAVPYLEEALRIGRLLGNDSLVNVALANLGVVAGREGNHARALALMDEALGMAKERGEPVAVARILLESSEIAAQQGQHQRSQTLAQGALRVYLKLGTFSPVPQCLEVLARTSLPLGQVPRAATLLGAADRARRDLGLATRCPPAGAGRGGPEWQRSWQEGARLAAADAILFALDEVLSPGRRRAWPLLTLVC